MIWTIHALIYPGRKMSQKLIVSFKPTHHLRCKQHCWNSLKIISLLRFRIISVGFRFETQNFKRENLCWQTRSRRERTMTGRSWMTEGDAWYTYIVISRYYLLLCCYTNFRRDQPMRVVINVCSKTSCNQVKNWAMHEIIITSSER